MKKMTIALLAFLPMALMAQNYRASYNQLSPIPTPQQIVKEQVRAEKAALYQRVGEQVETESERAAMKATSGSKAQQAKAQALNQQQKNATPQQKQAQQAMAADMMQIIQQLGIPMEQLAEMSDEQLQALIMPKVAQNMGLSSQDMEMLSHMSDREVEAYMKAHPEKMSSYQNSRMGQHAMALQGMSGAEEDDEDNELMTRIFDLHMQSVEISSTQIMTDVTMAQACGETYMAQLAERTLAPYQERIDAVYQECWARIEKEHPGEFYTAFPMPAYAKSYYDRMNAVVDEANLALATAWCQALDEKLNYYRSNLEKLMPFCDEQMRLYQQIKSPAAREMADTDMVNAAVYNALLNYLIVLKQRLEVPFMPTVEMPATYVPAGGMG